MHAWAWDKICKPKSEGGLAIRRIQETNNAASVKLVWSCCNSENSFRASWMKEQYFQDINFWEAPAHLLHSDTWKFVVKSR